MSNQDRIDKWRAGRNARAAHVMLPVAPDSAFAQECLAAGRDAVGDEPISVEAALAMMLRLFARAPGMTAGDRRVVYAAVQQGQQAGMDTLDLPAELAELGRRQLRSVVRLLEHDLRAGIAVHQAEYVPAGLMELNQRLLDGYARRERLREANQAMYDRSIAERDEVGTAAVDSRRENDVFHSTIAELSGNSRLARSIEEINETFPRNVSAQLLVNDSRHRDENFHEHTRILDALERGDAETARAEMREHVIKAGEQLARWYERRSSTVFTG